MGFPCCSLCAHVGYVQSTPLRLRDFRTGGSGYPWGVLEPPLTPIPRDSYFVVEMFAALKGREKHVKLILYILFGVILGNA